MTDSRTWKEELQKNARTGSELAKYLPLPQNVIEEIDRVSAQWPMSISPYYLSLIDPTDENDPIAKLCIPTAAEFLSEDGEEDQSGEAKNTVCPGLQHKYRQTVMFYSCGNCAMYCRHCFRKRCVGLGEEDESERLTPEILAYITAHTEITNVLISGGDAFLQDTSGIRHTLEKLCEIPHLRYLRFGTRTPVTFPQRILLDDEFIEMLREFGAKKQLYVSAHYNHPRELTEKSVAAIRRLQSAGVVVQNQAVLLHGINDDPETLAELMKRLSAHGIVPYYLFQCRPARGVKNHFAVPIREGAVLVRKTRAMLDGLANRFRYIYSCKPGKIEILDVDDAGTLTLRFHHAALPEDEGRLFQKKANA